MQTRAIEGHREAVISLQCPFCGGTHRSRYVDELEASVMACRDKVSPEDRGSLEAWGDRDTIPVPPEVEAYTQHG